MIAPAGTSTLLTDRNLGNVSRVCGRDDVQGTVAAGFAAGTLMAKSAYILHDGTTAAKDVADLFPVEAERGGSGSSGSRGRPSGRSSIRSSPRSRPRPRPRLLRRPLRSGGAVLETGARARRQGTPARPRQPRFSSLRAPGGRSRRRRVLHVPGGAARDPPRARPFLEDFRRRFGRDPGAHAARRTTPGGRAQGDRERRPGQRPQPRGRRRGRPQDENPRRHRRDRVRQQGDRKKALYFVSRSPARTPTSGARTRWSSRCSPRPGLDPAASALPGPSWRERPGRRPGRPSP